MTNLPSTFVSRDPNWRPYGWFNKGATAASGAGATGSGMFSGLKNMFGRAKSWGSQAFPNAKNTFRNAFSGTGAFNPAGFDWSATAKAANGANGIVPYGTIAGNATAARGPGLTLFGKNIGRGANTLSGIYYGAKALKGISDYNKVLQNNDDLMSDIRVSAMGNPLLSSYLTSDQLDLLRQIKSGTYDDNAGLDNFAEGAMSGLGDAILPTLIGGVAGGLPGAIIAGVGSLANSGIDNLSETSGENTSELQALYQALQDAEMQYKSMKRPNFTGLGIQQQYQNMYA